MDWCGIEASASQTMAPLRTPQLHDFRRFQITDHGTGDSLDLDAGK
jgi:hypothetical protein